MGSSSVPDVVSEEALDRLTGNDSETACQDEAELLPGEELAEEEAEEEGPQPDHPMSEVSTEGQSTEDLRTFREAEIKGTTHEFQVTDNSQDSASSPDGCGCDRVSMEVSGGSPIERQLQRTAYASAMDGRFRAYGIWDTGAAAMMASITNLT